MFTAPPNTLQGAGQPKHVDSAATEDGLSGPEIGDTILAVVETMSSC